MLTERLQLQRTVLEVSGFELLDILIWLDRLRESGLINMFGAAPELNTHFGLKMPLARKVLSYWMETFEERQAEELMTRDMEASGRFWLTSPRRSAVIHPCIEDEDDCMPDRSEDVSV